MIRLFIFPIIAIFTVFFISCSSKKLKVITGKWAGDVTLQSELASKNENTPPVAFLITKQHVDYLFSEDGHYTKQVQQVVENVEFIDKSAEQEGAKEYFSKYLNKTLVFKGEYEIKRKGITFTVETVQQNDGEVLSYDEFFAKDPAIGESEIYSPYEIEEGSLIIDGVKYSQ